MVQPLNPSGSFIPKSFYGSMPDGRPVYCFLLQNRNGLEMEVINYGGIITALKTPDRNGVLEDVALGYDTLAAYLQENPFFGALIGRYANRIGNGRFTLDGQVYALAQNNNGQHLHGGIYGFDRVYWEIEEHPSSDGPSLKLSYFSADGEEGYPGNLSVTVFYTLTNQDELRVEYQATTDKKTVVNLTQHTYFNLSGNTRKNILDHELTLLADTLVPVDDVLIPLGGLMDVTHTPFDFRKPTSIGARINDDHIQLKRGRGFDHCWVLSEHDRSTIVSSLYDPQTGRLVEVSTTEPGIQFYSGNFLNGSLTGKYGVIYQQRYGLCLETGHLPDSPNQPAFPSTVLAPGEVYRSETVYFFSTR